MRQFLAVVTSCRARLGSPGEPGLVVDFQGSNITVVVGEEEEEGEARLVRSFGEASIEARIQVGAQP